MDPALRKLIMEREKTMTEMVGFMAEFETERTPEKAFVQTFDALKDERDELRLQLRAIKRALHEE